MNSKCDDVMSWNVFPIDEESTVRRWISSQMPSNAHLWCYLRWWYGQAPGNTVKLPVIPDTRTFMCRHSTTIIHSIQIWLSWARTDFLSSDGFANSGRVSPVAADQLPHGCRFDSVWLTHWGRVTHICVGNLTIIGPDNGLSPGRRQAIIWSNAGDC